MQKIVPHLWFDKEAKAAAGSYASIFKGSAIKSSSTIEGTPSGTVDVLTISLCGQDFMLISAGPFFKFTPAISFLVACDTKEEVDELWGKLSPGGSALMELGAYPFSERYGWTRDKYGLSWQLMYAGGRPVRQKITPTLKYTGAQAGRAQDAMNFYVSTFGDAKIGGVMRYGKGAEPDKEGTVAHAGFTLEDQDFAAMDSARPHDFTFTEAISLVVRCADQAEIDRFWAALSADPKAEQCGWLKDKFGVSWQIVPTIMDEMMGAKDPEKRKRVTEAFLKMKKFDVAALQRAYDGK